MTRSANSSAQRYSQIATGLPDTDRNKSNARSIPSTSRVYKLEHHLQTDKEHSKSMSTPFLTPTEINPTPNPHLEELPSALPSVIVRE